MTDIPKDFSDALKERGLDEFFSGSTKAKNPESGENAFR
jgi:hypothetical protein